MKTYTETSENTNKLNTQAIKRSLWQEAMGFIQGKQNCLNSKNEPM